MKQRDIFIEAMQKEEGEERRVFLDAACGADVELRNSVEELLAQHQKDSSFFLDSPPPGLGATVDQPITEKPGAHIGPYKLLQQIGEGGMGVVYMAEQKEPVKRRVALKIIKPGMDTRQVVARFEAERQALAMMDHPNIAKVLDAGQTDSGRPYFVMELVNGLPVTKYCDEQHLNPKERLELFVPICQAVQHAHQKGIIHRDLKPSNILVAMYDNKAVPKIIDFGVAKATSQTLTDKTMFTQLGQVVGTLEYMSPEQAQRNQLDIDTRSDIYSLGVVLYELLTGETPFDRARLRSAAFDEMLRIIREEEPSKPSNKVSSSQSLPSIAANRRIEPAKLGSMIRGELDWIVLKAMEKDRGRRYETANKFAEDVQHYLNDEAVVACPPSRAYKFRKFTRRHRSLVVTATVVAAALLIAICGTTWGVLRAGRALAAEGEQRRLAEANERKATAAAAEAAAARQTADRRRIQAEKAAQAEAKARQKEAEERALAEAVADFVVKDFLALTSIEGQDRFGGSGLGRDASLQDLLDRAADKLKDRDDLSPGIEAKLSWIVGISYRGLGEPEKGIPFLEQAARLLKSLHGETNFDTLHADNSLAACYFAAGQPAKALPIFSRICDEANELLGLNDENTIQFLCNLAVAYEGVGLLDKALAMHLDLVERTTTTFGPVHEDTLHSMNNLAMCYLELSQLDEALTIYLDVVRLRKTRLGSSNLQTLASMYGLATCYKQMGQIDNARKLYEEVLPHRKSQLGQTHSQTLSTMTSLAECYLESGRAEEARDLLYDAWPLLKNKMGREHIRLLILVNNLAERYMQLGQIEKAIPLLRQALAQLREQIEPNHAATLASMQNLMQCLMIQGHFDEALQIGIEVLKGRKDNFGLEHDLTMLAMHHVAACYKAQGENEKLLSFHRESLELLKESLGLDHPHTLKAMASLAKCHKHLGQYDQAFAIGEQTLEGRKARLGPDHPDTLDSCDFQASLMWQQGQIDQSIRLLEKTYEVRRDILGENHPSILATASNLGVSYKAVGKIDQAIELLEWVCADCRANPAPYSLRCHLQLFEAYVASEQVDLAEQLIGQVFAVEAIPGMENGATRANVATKFGRAMLMLGRLEQAESLLRESLAFRTENTPDSWETFNVQLSLGEALLHQSKNEDAESHLVEGYRGMLERQEQIPQASRVQMVEAIDRLMALYTKLDDAEQLQYWRLERKKHAQQRSESDAEQ